jgi:hypothetical protein
MAADAPEITSKSILDRLNDWGSKSDLQDCLTCSRNRKKHHNSQLNTHCPPPLKLISNPST